MSHTHDIQHFVFATKDRRRTIAFDHSEDLYRFIWSLLRERDCTLYRINGMEEHIHMVVGLNPAYSKSRLMQEIKSYSSQWMKRSGLFPQFDGWGTGYFSESKDRTSFATVVEYVKNQRAHHSGIDFAAELRAMCAQYGVTLDDRDLR